MFGDTTALDPDGKYAVRLYEQGSWRLIPVDDRIPLDGMDVAPGHAYDRPHVDKANRASYECRMWDVGCGM